MPNPAQEMPSQAFMLEYRVRVLDGSTLSSPSPLPPAGLASDPCNKIVIEQDALGLIDLTGIGPRSYADRIVKWFLIVGPVPPTEADNVRIALDGETSKNERTIPPGASGLYSRNCVLVPQAHQLQLDGMTATPGNVIVVRLGIFLGDTPKAWAAMKKACCCLFTAVNRFGEPRFEFGIYPGCVRTVTGVAPPVVAQNAGPTVFTITGTNFTSGDVVAFVHADGTDMLPIANVVVVNPNTITAEVDVGPQEIGDYDVTVAAALSQGSCSGTREDAIEVTL